MAMPARPHVRDASAFVASAATAGFTGTPAAAVSARASSFHGVCTPRHPQLRAARAGARRIPRAALDPSFVTDHAHSLFPPGSLESVSLFLSDAAAVAVDAANTAASTAADAAASAGSAAGQAGAEAAAQAEKVGVWGSFVNAIEGALIFIHDTIAGAGIPGAYGITIIVFTCLIKVVTFPLNYQQMESTMKMQALTPRLRKIQSDYKDNPTAANQLIAQLYKDEQVNPLAGCAPVLIQIPVWLALYRCLLNLAKEDMLNESFLFLPSLQGPVSETGMGIDTWLFPFVNGAPPVGWHDALCYLVLPVILVISQIYSQKLLQPPNQDPSQAQANAVLKFIPFLLGWFSLTVPSGLGVYWVTNNLVSTLQTLYIRARFDQPDAQAATASDVPASSATLDVSPRPVTLEEKDGFSSKVKKKTASKGGGAGKSKRRKRR